MGKRDRNHDRGHGSHAGDPLVIDLPEGLKLYVGSLDDGMAIEVATWRGIGEPDSRVARMIIAANRDGAPQASANTIPLTDVSRLGARPGDGRAEASAWVQKETAAGEGAHEFEASGTTSGALRFARRAASILVGVPLSAATAAEIGRAHV